MNPVRGILLLTIRVYRFAISPILSTLSGPFGFGCRFTPTCSRYALEAVRFHGAWHGSILTVRRVCRCHPWGGSGHDPVPRGDPPLRPEMSLEMAAGEETRAPKAAR